jgi:3-deoxy-D-manno-octulosonic-acid transferase
VLLLYALLSGLTALLLAPIALILALVLPRARRGLLERLRPLSRGSEPSVWVHAASVGEAEAASPLIAALRERGVPVVATTTTTTGRARLRDRFPGLGARLAPLDLPGLVQLSVRRARVRVLALIETELWPNTVAACTGAGGQVVVLGGRLSDRSYPRYRRIRPLVAALLSRVAHVAARSGLDADRFHALGLPPGRSSLVGDLKLDREPASPPSPELAAALGPGPFLLAASTHDGEEAVLLGVWLELRSLAPELRLLLAPRHPERASGVLATARAAGATAELRSRGAARSDVVVLDSVGELASVYRHVDLVFSGGTLVPVGGHNLIEPVQAGRVVVLGPHTENQRLQVELLEPLGALHRVGHPRELRRVLEGLWSDPERDAPAVAARDTLEVHRGAVSRSLDRVLEALGA